LVGNSFISSEIVRTLDRETSASEYFCYGGYGAELLNALKMTVIEVIADGALIPLVVDESLAIGVPERTNTRSSKVGDITKLYHFVATCERLATGNAIVEARTFHGSGHRRYSSLTHGSCIRGTDGFRLIEVTTCRVNLIKSRLRFDGLLVFVLTFLFLFLFIFTWGFVDRR
jgi:hypothetical protein